jgi:hypothetical protein
MSGGIVVLLEGKTEINTLAKLCDKRIIRYDKHVTCGSREFYRNIVQYLQPLVRESDPPIEGETPRTFVILRDLDSGRELQDVKRSTEDAVNEALGRETGERIKLLQHSRFSNIFFVKNRKFNFIIVLHIAQRRCIEGVPTFRNCTTDDYVLDLALRKETIENLPEFKKAQENNPDLNPEDIQNKVKSEIFGILEDNGIEFREAKGVVNLYIAVLQLGGEGSMRYAELPGKMIEHARQEDIEEVFESWVTAFKIAEEGLNEP